MPEESIKVTGVDFYESVSAWGPLNRLYKMAEAKYFDLYEVLAKIVLTLTRWLSAWQNGLVHTYLAWYLVGAVLVVYLLMR
jgi:hypothetical protein